MKEDCKSKILLAEDDENLGYILKDFLEISGYIIHWEKDGKKALEAFRKGKFNLCILDIMMPVMDGFTLAKEIRAIAQDIPFIFLTAKAMKEDRIKGLKTGADDYITKPFSTEELVLRIEAILRRCQVASDKDKDTQTRFVIGKYLFNVKNQLLTWPGNEKYLTKREADVLYVLCSHQGELVKREAILKQIWGDDDYFMGRSMDVYITKLRKYMSEDKRISIRNVHGSGFMLEILDA
ncbi:MAG: response regulator transcription factor [Bacteroidia bacterium]|nr:response regulator transcription factor [Bacteroidia bacterium]